MGELWFVKDHENGVIGIERQIVPFFSTREHAEEWIMASRLEQHFAVVLDNRQDLMKFMQDVEAHYPLFTLDPPIPTQATTKIRVAPIRILLEGTAGVLP